MISTPARSTPRSPTAPDPSDEGEQVTVTATFTDAAPNVVYTATIDWGDGTPPPRNQYNPITGARSPERIHIWTRTASEHALRPLHHHSDRRRICSATPASARTTHGRECGAGRPHLHRPAGPPQPVGTPVTVLGRSSPTRAHKTPNTATNRLGGGNITAGWSPRRAAGAGERHAHLHRARRLCRHRHHHRR